MMSRKVQKVEGIAGVESDGRLGQINTARAAVKCINPLTWTYRR